MLTPPREFNTNNITSIQNLFKATLKGPNFNKNLSLTWICENGISNIKQVKNCLDCWKFYDNLWRFIYFYDNFRQFYFRIYDRATLEMNPLYAVMTEKLSNISEPDLKNLNNYALCCNVQSRIKLLLN